jgi:antitoxin component YwqK of YwqJK toxin-antitoxin module
MDPDDGRAPAALDGPVTRRDAQGRVVEEAQFRAGRLNGPFRLFAPDGTPLREANYRDGLAEGVATDYDAQGRKLAETRWVAGRREGPSRLWRDGRLAMEAVWRDDALDGPMRLYDAAGVLAAVVPHRAGRIDGVMEVYDPHGRVVLRAAHEGGLRHGPSVVFDAEGREVERADYAWGRPVGAAGPAPGADAAAAPADPVTAFYARLAAEGAAVRPPEPSPARRS